MPGRGGRPRDLDVWADHLRARTDAEALVILDGLVRKLDLVQGDLTTCIRYVQGSPADDLVRSLTRAGSDAAAALDDLSKVRARFVRHERGGRR